MILFCGMGKKKMLDTGYLMLEENNPESRDQHPASIPFTAISNEKNT